jgi:hypothetical protein
MPHPTDTPAQIAARRSALCADLSRAQPKPRYQPPRGPVITTHMVHPDGRQIWITQNGASVRWMHNQRPRGKWSPPSDVTNSVTAFVADLEEYGYRTNLEGA